MYAISLANNEIGDKGMIELVKFCKLKESLKLVDLSMRLARK